MAEQTTRFAVTGYRELLRACARGERDTKRYVRAAFREVGERVKARASLRFSVYDARTAAGFKIRVRQRGVAVEQSLRKTTGLRPDFGALQMTTALLPALMENRDEIRRSLDEAVEKVAHAFEEG